MLTAVLVVIVAVGFTAEVIRCCGVKKSVIRVKRQQGKNEMLKNTISNTAHFIRKNAIPAGEWDNYEEAVKTMISGAMKRINDRNLAVVRFWKDLTEEEKLIIQHSQKYAAGLDRFSKNLAGSRYPDEAKHLIYDEQLKTIAQGPNPSIIDLRKLPVFYLNYLEGEEIQ